jgi:tetratricopeptide (TPR) repeat protein
MPAQAASQVVFIKSRNILVRLLLVLAVLGALALGWFAFTREIGNLVTEVTEPTDPSAKDAAVAAQWLAPSDPFVSWLFATSDNNSFDPTKSAATVQNFEEVIRLSPNDYRWWIELGRVREQVDDSSGSEQALKRSIELAPTYAYPRWQLGNFYLRQGRPEEAFDQLKLAAANNPTYREQVFFTVWEFFNHDKSQLDRIVGTTPEVSAYLARFYATHDQPDDCLRTWNTLSPQDKEDNKAIGAVIFQGLFERRHFKAALAFAHEQGRDAPEAVGTMQNGGFELPIAPSKQVAFGWLVSDKEKVDIKEDTTQKHDGKKSLRLSFNAFNEPILVNASQITAVEPGTKYSLTFWLRTENLKSASTPVIQVDAVNDTRTLGVSNPFPIGANDWQQIKIDFTVPNDVDGVVIRTVRTSCGENCPLVGMVWYDDFNLQKIG